MTAPKRLSTKIDETVESLLLFIVRYFRTIGRILRAPWRPERVLNHATDPASELVRPLTFLALGAFAFAQLMGVFPIGVTGLTAMIWQTDDIKQAISENWTALLSLTSLVTAGLPIILSVAGLAAISSRILFRAEGTRRRWYEASLYAFGFQSVLFLFLFTLDVAIDSLLAALPLLGRLPLPEDPASYLLLAILIVLALVALLWPYVFLTVTFRKLDVYERGPSSWRWGIAPLYVTLQFIVYPGAASIVPSLKQQYFEAPAVSYQIERYVVETYAPDREHYQFRVELLVDNPTTTDTSVYLEPIDWSFHWGILEEEPKESWLLYETSISVIEPASSAAAFIARRGALTRVILRFEQVTLASIYCQAYSLAVAQDYRVEHESYDGLLDSLYLEFDQEYVDQFPVDIEDFFGIDFFVADEIEPMCASELNK